MTAIAATTAAYRIEHLRFSYNRSPDSRPGQDWALQDLSFDIAAGSIVGVIGPNGSGKSSLLKLLARVLRPQAGTIHLLGHELQSLSQAEAARMVALVPQDSLQVFPFTIAEIVLMGRFPHHRSRGNLAAFGWESPEDLRLAEEAMRETDVTHLASRSIGDVSGGERQRAIIARALTQQPRVLLLDEPTAFLDLHHQLDICRILRRLNEERALTIILVSHDLNLASQYCDRLLLLSGGRIARHGIPQEVIRPEVLEAVYGCQVLVDAHPQSGLPRVTLPGRQGTGTGAAQPQH